MTTIRFHYKVSKENQNMEQTVDLKIDEALRQNLVSVLENPESGTTVELPSMFPKIQKIDTKGNFHSAPDILPQGVNDPNQKLLLKFHKSESSGWWQLNEVCNNNPFRQFPYHKCDDFLTMYFFNEKSFSNKSQLGQLVIKG